MRRVLRSVMTPPSPAQFIIPSGLFSGPHALVSLIMVPVIVILMHDHNRLRKIHDRASHRARMPDEPVIPSGPPNGKGKQVGAQPLAKSEVVNPFLRTLPMCSQCQLP